MFIHNIIYYKTAVNSVSQTMRFITPGGPNNCHTLNFNINSVCLELKRSAFWLYSNKPGFNYLHTQYAGAWGTCCGKVI